MDSVLKDLKKIREETEEKLNQAIDKLESINGKAEEKLSSLNVASDENHNQEKKQLSGLLQELQSCNREVCQAIRQTVLLNNARSAELARQLTILPLERMDIVLDRFEGRLESLEAEVDRLKKENDS